VRKLFLHKIWQISLVFWVIVIWGCAAPPTKPTEEKDPFSIFPERYRNKAMEYEKKEELQKALQSWEIVSSFTPSDEAVVKRIVGLKAQIQTLSDQHFKKGLSYYKTNSIESARREFLLVLSYNPDHKEALDYLKHKLTGEDYILYEVGKGDTLKAIAKKKYNDAQKDFLIAYFNDLGKDGRLGPKTTLKLPILEATPIKQVMGSKGKEIPIEEKGAIVDTKEMLNKAMVSFKGKNYQETASITQEILTYDPSNKDARDLANASNYQMGKILSQEKKFQEALESFSRVEPGYKDVKQSISFVKRELAGTHYIKGVKYFTDEEIDKAIKEWEETLTLDPNHPKAKKDIENARNLLQKLKEIK
jgi:tetratricopeptide (TPR) repeat protein